MKLVVSKNWGGFYIPEELSNLFNGNRYSDSTDTRTNPIFIDWVKKHEDCGLSVIEIPDGFHHRVIEYDGFETVYYSEKEIFRAW